VDGLICYGFYGLWLEGVGVAALLHCMNHCVLSACVRVCVCWRMVCVPGGWWEQCRLKVGWAMVHGSWIATRRGVLGAAWREALVGCVMEIVMLF